MRIAHVSDTHLGYSRYAKLCPKTHRNQREVDASDAYRRAVDAILERDVDLVVHSGDVFDTIRPATHVIVDFLRESHRILREDIPYVGIAGNHETPRLRSTTAALAYANLLGADFAYGFEPDKVRLEAGGATVCVTLLPHGAVADRDLVVNPDGEADLNILVTHGTVPGLEIQGHELGQVDLPEGVLDLGFDYVALGHYHGFGRHGKASCYAGATERFSFAEVDFEPGFALVEISGDGLEIEHVPIAARPMIDLPAIDARGMDGADLTEAIRERVSREELDGAIVRLKVTGAASGIGGEVDRALLRELRGRCLNFSLEVSGAEAGAGGAEEAPSSATFGPLEEEFEGFVRARRENGEMDEGFAQDFLRRGLGYLQRAGEEERGGAA
ncbi:metallophosphoesterase family protein [Rubrobacter naiadicus]|uniref:metallophosphoesterase family protein n=1 Tax=Rubrobacter naiadicus TaxID=1392641 RepID=UPI00235F0070|nr:exonuclease SbcCD subunit D [Rubrobacter naiadicus]